MDSKRIKENPTDDNDCYTQQCKHCNTLISFPWKANGMLMPRPIDGPGAYHAAHAQRHLEKWRDRLGFASIEQRTNDKKEA